MAQISLFSSPLTSEWWYTQGSLLNVGSETAHNSQHAFFFFFDNDASFDPFSILVTLSFPNVG